MNEWQPIETAPKNGESVLLFYQNEMVGCGEYSDEIDGLSGYWFVYGSGECNPTHWMPLPQPPEGV